MINSATMCLPKIQEINEMIIKRIGTIAIGCFGTVFCNTFTNSANRMIDWLQMNYVKNREKGAGSGPQALNCQRVRELDFFVPNIEEQKEIVRLLDDFITKEQQVKDEAEVVIEQIDIMKKSVLARAFRRELGTNDPVEENTLELLKSIL